MVSATTNYGATVSTDEVIGIRHPPLPAGVEDLAGAVIREADGRSSDLPWILSSVRVRGRPLLLLSRSIERREGPIVGSDGRTIGVGSYPILEVTDAVLLPPLADAERLMMSRCATRDGTAAIAYVRWEQERVLREVSRTWQADLIRGRLLEIDPTGTSCEGPPPRRAR